MVPRSEHKLNSSVAVRVLEIVKEQLGLEDSEISLDSAFIEDLGADSLDIVELIMAMEEEFGVEIPDEDAEFIIKIQDAVNYIESHLEKRTH